MTAAAPRRYVVLCTTIALLSIAWFACYATFGAGPSAIAYLGLPLGATVSTAAVISLLRGGGLVPAARRFWRLILVLEACLAAGYAGEAVKAFVVFPAYPNQPMAGAACCATGIIAAIVAVARLPLGIDNRAERWRQRLDRAIAFLGCGTILWQFGLAPMFTTKEVWARQGIILVGLAFLLIIGGVTKVAYIGDGPVDRRAVRLVAATGLAGAAFAVAAVHLGHRGTAPSQALFMPFAPLFVTIAVRCQQRPARPRRQHAGLWLPYLAVAAVDVPLLTAFFQPVTWETRIVAIAALTVTLLVAFRQYLAYVENRTLFRAKRASEERLAHEATHDALTGLANRRLFRQRLEEQLNGPDGATVALVDLDDFKRVNDSLGHEVGDALLVATAAVLSTAAGPHGLAARIGGDEFAILVTDPQALGETVVRAVLDGLGEPLSEHRLLMHASAGLATADPGTAPDSLLRDADTALYAAKQRGKANWVRFLPGMQRPALADAQLGADLRRALEAGEFRLVYQPLVGLGDGAIIGMEALVRWHHPERGVVSPAEFIPAAERTGLIVPLGRWVLRETCRQTAAWLAEFGPGMLQKAGPNVSVRQLHDPDFVSDVRAALADSGLPADRLVLELTESAVLRGQQVSGVLHELHAMGVRLALDDFGTGESSLSLLRAFPASIVKLDKTFVDGIELDEPGTPAAHARQAVARAVAQLADALSLDTVAEGIENQAQADRLFALGYRIGQGYHLARPMPAADVTALLAARVKNAALTEIRQ